MEGAFGVGYKNGGLLVGQAAVDGNLIIEK